jgi:hypothetical protein
MSRTITPLSLPTAVGAREPLSDAQYTRYKNTLNTRMKCLISKVDSKGNAHFLVESSQRYKVTIGSNGKVNCSCPDYSCRSKSEELVCKHALFILMQHLKVITRLDHAFFTRRGKDDGVPMLSMDEVSQVRGFRAPTADFL